jgi:hypothetical protein
LFFIRIDRSCIHKFSISNILRGFCEVCLTGIDIRLIIYYRCMEAHYLHMGNMELLHPSFRHVWPLIIHKNGILDLIALFNSSIYILFFI